MKKALFPLSFLLLSLLSFGGFLVVFHAGLDGLAAPGAAKMVLTSARTYTLPLLQDPEFMKELLRAHFVPVLFALIPGCLLLLLKRRAEKRAKWHAPVFYGGILPISAAVNIALHHLAFEVFAPTEIYGPAAPAYQSFILWLTLTCFTGFFSCALLAGLDILLDAVSKKRGGEAPASAPQPVS